MYDNIYLNSPKIKMKELKLVRFRVYKDFPWLSFDESIEAVSFKPYNSILLTGIGLGGSYKVSPYDS